MQCQRDWMFWCWIHHAWEIPLQQDMMMTLFEIPSWPSLPHPCLASAPPLHTSHATLCSHLLQHTSAKRSEPVSFQSYSQRIVEDWNATNVKWALRSFTHAFYMPVLFCSSGCVHFHAICRVLICWGFCVVVQNSGATTLHVACCHGHEPIVTYLLSRGASVHAFDMVRWKQPASVWSRLGWKGFTGVRMLHSDLSLCLFISISHVLQKGCIHTDIDEIAVPIMGPNQLCSQCSYL